MPTLSVSGLNYATDRVSIDATGSAVTTNYPAKTFLVKNVGGQCYLKRDSTVADGDAYIMDDGEMISFDLKLDYSTTDGVTIGFFKALSGTVTLHLVIGY